LRGAAVPVLDDVSYSRTFGYAHMDVTSSGMLLYRRSAGSGRFVASWIERGGSITQLLTTSGRYAWPRLSPDGNRLALTDAESGSSDIRVYDVRTGETHRLPGTNEDHSGFAWLPNAHALIFGGRGGMAWSNPDSAEAPRSLTRGAFVQAPWSYSSRAARLAYGEMTGATGFDLWTVGVSTSSHGVELGTPEPFLRTGAFEVYPAFSPDGRWIAYSSNESGAYQIYVRRFPDDGRAIRVSQRGGRVPIWSPNGRELLFETDEQRVMVASYRVVNGAFVAESARAWSRDPLGDTGVLPGFDVAPDGEHIVALVPAAGPNERQSPNHATLMLNFAAEVRRHSASSAR
jgi:serine/threonine-protein kinase